MSCSSESPTLEVKEKILLNFLRNDLHIKAETEYHAPSDTVEDWVNALNGRYVDSEHVSYKLCKNLFLHHKKQKHRKYYGVALAETKVDMNSMSKVLGLGSGNLRFADNEDLPLYLDIMPGSVTPLCFHILDESVQKVRPDLVNAKVIENMKSLTIIMDAAMFNKSENLETVLLFHPLHNAASTGLTQLEFAKFMKHCLGDEAWSRVIVYDFSQNEVVPLQI